MSDRPADRVTEAAPAPTCDYCGSLAWTVEMYGFVVHKQHCPHRTDERHQGNPGLWNPDPPVAVPGPASAKEVHDV